MDLSTFSVVVLDIDKINASIDAAFKATKKVLDSDTCTYEYKLNSPKLCYTVNNKGVIAIFDNDLVGTIIDENKMYPVQIFEIMDTKEGKRIGLSPVVETEIDVSVLISEYTSKNETIPEFMGTRYNYNSRIQSNQSEFIKFIKG